MTTPNPSSPGGSAASPAQAPTGSRGTPGAVIGGRYTLQDPIGAGGMGAVWKAHDDLLQRDVAVKEVLLPPGIPAEERAAMYERTLREARAAASLSHPSVVQVYDVITDNERPWIVMELLTARSLADMIGQRGKLPPRAIAKIGLSVLGALEAAHARGVLHRDVKPANVLICSDGRCVLTDFGVARIMTENANLTTPGMVLGSPQYISPERATGSDFGPPSDLFSLGVTLYTASEGKPPFDRGDPLATMHAVVYEEPEPPRNAGPLAPILLGLLAKDPAQRWGVDRTREGLRSALAGPLSGNAPPQQPVPPQPTRALASPMAPQPSQLAVPQQISGPPNQMRASAPVPSAPPAQSVYLEARPVGPPRRLGPWLVGAGAAVVAILLIVFAIGAVNGWFSTKTGGTKPTAVEKSPNGRTITDSGGRYTSMVPKDWKLVSSRNFVQYSDPSHADAWIRFNATGSGQNARQFLATAANGLRHSRDYSQFRELGLTAGRRMAGRTGAELEYTLVQNSNGQHRHAIWRTIVVNGTAYQVYMSVPADMFAAEKPVFQQAVQQFALK